MEIKGRGGEEWRSFEERKIGGGDDWRALAEGTDEAIEKYRKADARWRLLDREGRPLANRKVRVEQRESAFTWGFNSWSWMNAMEHGRFFTMPERHRREARTALFNSIILLHYWAEKTPDDAPVSEEYQGEIDYELLESMVNWCRGHGLRCKGHPLFWPVPKALPEWLGKYDPETRWKFVEVRIRQITSRFRGRITQYDLSNEMLWEPLLANTARRHWPHIEPVEAIAADHARILGWAREEDPDAVYLLNEYGLVAGETDPLPVKDQEGREVTRDLQVERYLRLVEEMRKRGQAPDAAGLQTAPGEWEALSAFRRTIDRLAETGLPVHITEFRPNTKGLDEAGLPDGERDELLADYLETAYRLSFAHPACEAFYLWDHGILTRGRRRTAIWERLHRLLQEEWKTSLETETDGDGWIRFRGFAGGYRILLERAAGASGYPAELLPNSPSPQEREFILPFLPGEERKG